MEVSLWAKCGMSAAALVEIAGTIGCVVPKDKVLASEDPAILAQKQRLGTLLERFDLSNFNGANIGRAGFPLTLGKVGFVSATGSTFRVDINEAEIEKASQECKVEEFDSQVTIVISGLNFGVYRAPVIPSFSENTMYLNIRADAYSYLTDTLAKDYPDVSANESMFNKLRSLQISSRIRNGLCRLKEIKLKNYWLGILGTVDGNVDEYIPDILEGRSPLLAKVLP